MLAAQNVKQALKKSAKQIRNEPLEILKSAAKQVSGDENIKLPWEDGEASDATQASNWGDDKSSETSNEESEYKKKVAEQDGRRLQALESELSDIRRQNKFKELMAKIQNGEDIAVEAFQDLSAEQRDVLKAQLEASQKRKKQASVTSSLPEPVAKKGRRMVGGGQRQSAQKQTTRVEKPVPPSG